MKLLSNRVGVYLGIFVLGGALGFWGTRSEQPPMRVERAQTYPVAISPSPSLAPKQDREVNFIATAVQKVGPAVVRIDAARQVSSALPENFNNPLFRRFFGQNDQQNPNSIPERIERGTGSGFIIGADGRLITNAHVVNGAETVRVTLKDGTSYQGKVLGTDSFTDVAVIKIEATDLPTVSLGNADDLIPGEWAIAIGNPLGLDNTVTVGIVSALDRSSSQVGVPDKRVRFIQTDAAINPGNSGGPLLNSLGEVIGINTAIRADAQGLGFAIPIGTAQRIANQLFTKGQADHPYLGVHMVNLTPETRDELNSSQEFNFDLPTEAGVVVVRVIPRSPAAKSGFQAGDVISKVGGKDVATSLQVQEQVDSSVIGSELEVKIIRDGKSKIIKVKPSAFPQERS
ncbi:MAG: HhoA/HhoB/HtrA family serine endopeptidase [Cyanobacteria bacterium J06600_6]